MRSTYFNPNSHTIGFPNDENTFYDQLYKRVSNSLLNGYAVIYAAEPNISSESQELVIKHMESGGIANVQEYLDKDLLTITDPEAMYYLAGINPQKLVRLWKSFFLNTERKSEKKLKGILAVYSPDSYFKRNHHDLFIAFEQMMGRRVQGPVELLCWYKKKWLAQLPLAFLIRVLASHEDIVYKGWKSQQWDADRIIRLIGTGIDRELGEKSSMLVLNTIKMRFKLTRDKITSRPEDFEDCLRRVLGDSADQVIEVILETMRDEIAFDPMRNGLISRRNDQ